MQPHKRKQRRQTDRHSVEIYQINWQATREDPSENDWRVKLICVSPKKKD
jgi:hypothetical protein